MSIERVRVRLGHVDGAWTVSWPSEGGETIKRYSEPPCAVISLTDPSGVLIVEPADGPNAVIFNLDGQERLRISEPPGDFFGYGQCFEDERGLAIVNLATFERGYVDPRTGGVSDFEHWTLWNEA